MNILESRIIIYDLIQDINKSVIKTKFMLDTLQIYSKGLSDSINKLPINNLFQLKSSNNDLEKELFIKFMADISYFNSINSFINNTDNTIESMLKEITELFEMLINDELITNKSEKIDYLWDLLNNILPKLEAIRNNICNQYPDIFKNNKNLEMLF